jgi:dCTP diphosphatase
MTKTIEELQSEVIRFRDERDWAQFHKAKDLALGLQIEAGELAELFLWKTEKEIEAALDDPELRQRLEHELADVTIFILYLAEKCGISIPDAVESKLKANAAKYPVERAKGSAAKYTDFDPKG